MKRKKNKNISRVLTGLVLGMIAIPSVFIATGRSTHLTCEKLEMDYVVCQLEKRYIHGLWPTSPQEFRLAKVDIESQYHRSDDGNYYTYKIYLYSPTEKHFLSNYGKYKYVAETDQIKLNILINGPINAPLQLTRRYWFRDLLFILCCAPIILIIFVIFYVCFFDKLYKKKQSIRMRGKS